MASIWSYGHSNPQGLARHPVTGELWSTEHGPRGGDELNLVRKGLNYGWPIITYGMNYNGTPITSLTEKEGLEQPVLHWTPSIAVCGIAFYQGDKFPRWKHHLFVTALAQEELRRLVLDGHRVVEQEVLFKNIGRVRHVASGPDGFVYVVFNKPDGGAARAGVRIRLAEAWFEAQGFYTDRVAGGERGDRRPGGAAAAGIVAGPAIGAPDQLPLEPEATRDCLAALLG
jgi:glucose/arabinose dehydrogenase